MFFTYIVRYTRLFSLYSQASDVGETQDLVPAAVCYLFLNSELASYVIPCSMVLIGKLIVVQLVKKLLALYRPEMFQEGA